MSVHYGRILKGALPKNVIGLAAYYLSSGTTTFSQYGEDLVLRRLLPEATGFYVDIGAFHPKFASNTYFLNKRGWSGINIDVDEYKVRLFNRVRRNDINLAAVVSGSKEKRCLHVQEGESYGSMTTLEEDFAFDRASRFQRKIATRTVETTTLVDLLDQYLPMDRKDLARPIDFVNIDVEGHEHAILETFDFGRYRPGCWCIEIHADSIDELRDTPTYQLLTANNYRMVGWYAPSCLFSDTAPHAA